MKATKIYLTKEGMLNAAIDSNVYKKPNFQRFLAAGTGGTGKADIWGETSLYWFKRSDLFFEIRYYKVSHNIIETKEETETKELIKD